MLKTANCLRVSCDGPETRPGVFSHPVFTGLRHCDLTGNEWRVRKMNGWMSIDYLNINNKTPISTC